MGNKKTSDPNNIRPVTRYIAIPLSGFEPVHTSHDRTENAHLFVGRKIIIDKLVDLLKSKSRRGSYLIAGYRGAGKTSVINRAIKEFRGEKGSKRVGFIVRINLGDNSQLTPLNIYYSIASILRDEIASEGTWWEKVMSSIIALRTIDIFAFIVVSSAALAFLFEPIDVPRHFYNGALVFLFLFVAVKAITLVVPRAYFPHLKALNDIDLLIERMSYEISEERKSKVIYSGFGFGLSKSRKNLPINAREAEEQLFRIFEKIQNVGFWENNLILWRKRSYEKKEFYKKQILNSVDSLNAAPQFLKTLLNAQPRTEQKETNRKVVIVLDEIDKLSDNEELVEPPYHVSSNTQEAGKINRINSLLGSLKNFITTAEATFFFISGRETLDRYYSEKSSSNSLYASLFDRVFEVPSFLTDPGDRPRGIRLSALIEEYVCRCIKEKKAGGQKSQDSYLLSSYRELLEKNRINAKTYDFDKEDIRRCINTLATFIHYLTFHSWGNPKRLSSIFESFIVLKKKIIEDQQNGSKFLIMNQARAVNDSDPDYWLVFNANQQRSFSLASEITTLFQHQLSREVSKISDKLTVSTLSSLHFILKLHSYGFTRESLHRMSEAINVYRSPELNTIVDDLLTQVFKSYIRRVRNGIFRYRFNSGFEQELRYISHVSELESATYNFSLDSMRHVQRFFENILTNNEDMGVIARSHITLGDMCAIEQSYTAASVHYATASKILDKNLQKTGAVYDRDTLMQYVEVMLKYGDLEERRENYNHAAAVYLNADEAVKNSHFINAQSVNDLGEDSKWDLLKQPFWAHSFLSLKRGIPASNYHSPRPSYLYSEGDMRYFYRYANLLFFLGENDLSVLNYEKVVDLATPINNKKGVLNERTAYLLGKALVGLAENSLCVISRKLNDRYLENASGENGFAKFLYLELLSTENLDRRVIQEDEPLIKHKTPTKIRRKSLARRAEYFIGLPLRTAANIFERNHLYISAAITHIKIISYYAAILDVFDSETYISANIKADLADPVVLEDIACFKPNLLEITSIFFKEIHKSGLNALRCINKARQLETSQSNKTLLIYDFENRDDSDEMRITRLFDMLLDSNTSLKYPKNEAIFWQNSLWAHKLAAALCWATFVKRKIETNSQGYTADQNVLSNLPGILGLGGFSVGPGILMRWVSARDSNREHIDRKLVLVNDKSLSLIETLDHLVEAKPRSDLRLTSSAVDVISYVVLVLKKGVTVAQAQRVKIPPILIHAYVISRNLYLAQESSRVISRKNLDLIFPRLPQIHFAQWKLLLNLLIVLLIDRENLERETGEALNSVRDFAFLLQRTLVTIDEVQAPDERIAPSHLDYEFIFLRLQESVESSITLVDRTSRVHKGIFQHKYFCHDDHSDPDFRMDYTLAHMFTPRAANLKGEIERTHKKFHKTCTESPHFH